MQEEASVGRLLLPFGRAGATLRSNMGTRVSILFGLSLSLVGCDGGASKKTDEPQGAVETEAQKIWESRCVNCHGAKGQGDGPGAATLEPKPRSFADPAWQGRTPDEQITKIILQGGMGVQMSPAMPEALVLKIRKMQQ